VRPIRIPPLTTSFLTRRTSAVSRVKAIIVPFAGRLELPVIVFTALAVLVFFGTTYHGQASALDNWFQFTSFIEETTISWRSSTVSSSELTANQFAGIGGFVDASPAVSDAPTIHENTVIAISAPRSDYMDTLSKKRNTIIEYTVQDGDLLSFIAADYGVSVESIIWANKLVNADDIALGQVLRIPPVSGVIHKVAKGDTASSLAKKYSADEARIIAYNQLPQGGALEVGDEIVIPDGRTTLSTGTSTGVATTRKATFSHLADLGSYFIKPTSGTLTRGGAIHGRNGIDIANQSGTPIYAAADGVVSLADAMCESKGFRCNGGYGYYLKITHPNGTETLYAHASKLLVAAGQSVGRGQLIAYMGTTGNSTGNHLHFEVHGARNPLARY
jgi:murein DD-endopeptidase MepM/ murein hydrolase activator NlpD